MKRSNSLTFWRLVLVVALSLGAYATFVRFGQGLGASTNLSDDFPWGLWIGFDVLCGVSLAAGGFTLSAIGYIFHLERFKAITRPAILTAFLGYFLVIVALMFDLGQSMRIWHPLVLWNPSSVMFEVAWCVMLYFIVLGMEFSHMLWEKLRWEKMLKMTQSIMIPLVIAGVTLSMLHQSSLGSLYLIVPGKLHPLWYSPFLPIFFFISALAMGCAMTIFESFLSYRAFRKRLELDLLSDLARLMVVVLTLYLVFRVQDLLERDALRYAFEASYEGRLFLAEITLGVVGPLLLLAFPAVRRNDQGLFVSSLMVLSGFVMNRLNVSVTGMERSAGTLYAPSWTEVSITLALVGLGVFLFALAVRYLPVFPSIGEGSGGADEGVDLPAPAMWHQPWRSTAKLALVAGMGFFLLALALASSGLRYRQLTPESDFLRVEQRESTVVARVTTGQPR